LHYTISSKTNVNVNIAYCCNEMTPQCIQWNLS